MRNSAPLIAATATVALCVAFWLPLGGERFNRTTYQALQGLAATFGPPPALSDRKPDVAQTPRQDTRMQDNASPATTAAAPMTAGPARRRLHRKGVILMKKAEPELPDAVQRAPGPTVPEPIDTPRTVPSPTEGVPQPASPAPPAVVPPRDYTADIVRDAFEACDSKFPLDTKASAGGVTLRLQGLCRWQGRFIVKATVGNQSGADFFIKTLDAYDGAGVATVKSFFRLFVEPERTREGFVLFEAGPGAQVKVVLKEDRENARSLQAPVRYPF